MSEWADPDVPPYLVTRHGVEIPLPVWAADLVLLLVETEGHTGRVVRQARKALAQAATTLDAARKYDGGEPAQQWPQPIAATSPRTSIAVATEKKKRKAPRPSAAQVLMKRHGIDAAMVRAWCKDTGRDVAKRGVLSEALVRAYIEGVA